jgi:dCTP deaminase
VRIAQTMWLWPQTLKLASTIERFHMPKNYMGWIADKSSWVRRGLCVQNSKIEPGWVGYLTLELTNHTWFPIRLKRGMPIAQIVFVKLDKPTDAPYKGKYQYQGPLPQSARIEGERV